MPPSVLTPIDSQWDAQKMLLTQQYGSLHSFSHNSLFILFLYLSFSSQSPERLMLIQTLLKLPLINFHPTLCPECDPISTLYSPSCKSCKWRYRWWRAREQALTPLSACLLTLRDLWGYKLQPPRCDWRPGPVPGKLYPSPGSATL